MDLWHGSAQKTRILGPRDGPKMFFSLTMALYKASMHEVGTVDSQPKVKGVKVKTLGLVGVKIIRSRPSILGSQIGHFF